MKDICDAGYFKNLSMFEEDNSNCESSSFDKDSSAYIGLESELDDGSNETQRKSLVEEECSCAPKKRICAALLLRVCEVKID